jgi:hypothetical protein
MAGYIGAPLLARRAKESAVAGGTSSPTWSAPNDHDTPPEPTYEPELTGLIIVDPYNDFLSEGGKLYELGRGDARKIRCRCAHAQILAAIREKGIQVFIAPHHRWREGDQHLRWKTVPPIGAAGFKGRAFMDGTWGGSFHPDFEPQRGDVVAQQHWLSRGFANNSPDTEAPPAWGEGVGAICRATRLPSPHPAKPYSFSSHLLATSPGDPGSQH